MKKISLLIVLIAVVTLSSCNYFSKHFGGTVTVKVPVNCEVVNVTWKESSLWILYRDTTNNSLFFVEDSNFGILNGKVIFK